jgi:predicted Zn-dependent peptidase
MSRVYRVFAAALVVAAFGLTSCKTTSEKDSASAGRVPPDEPFRADRPEAGPSPEVTLPKFEKTTTKNGLTVYVANVPELPIVDARLVVAAGAAQESAKQAGLASLTYDMLDEGAGDYDAIGLADAVASLGAQLSVGGGRESGSASIQILRRNLDDGVGLLALLAQQPRFSSKDFSRIQKQRLSALKARAGDPRSISSDLFSEVAFGAQHPYGHPAAGTEESVNGLSVRDVKKFWSGHAGPKTSALIFAGDITTDDAIALAEKHFSRWRSKAKRAKAPADPPAGKLSVHVVNLPGTPQTVVRIGRPLIKRGDPDEFALEVMNRALGGMFSSRLNLKLREEKQFTYGAGSGLAPGRGVGPWSAGAGIKVEHTAEAIGDFFAEFERILAEPPSEKELAGAKDNLIKSFPARFETISSMSSAAAELFLYDLEGDFFAQVPTKVQAITAEDLKRVAERAMVKDQMRVVLVGDLEKFKAGLEELKLGELVVVER